MQVIHRETINKRKPHGPKFSTTKLNELGAEIFLNMQSAPIKQE